MDRPITLFESLKDILRHVRNPELLDNHPWTRSLIVHEAVDKLPHLTQANPGQQLIGAIASLFPQLQPANPPRDGKRLDPRWGEFGLLAALYFTPFNHGTPFPTSLLDAWGRIDPAILYFVYGRSAEELSEVQVKKYQLVGSDIDYGSTSTLSDWHKKGLQRFAELILNRERYLIRSSDKPSPILDSTSGNDSNGQATPATSPALGQKRWPVSRRSFWLLLSLLMVMVLGFGAVKGWKIYDKGRTVYEDVTRLRGLARASMATMSFEGIHPELLTLQNDLKLFNAEAQPLFWLGSRLGWVPKYGGDLVSVPALAELAEHLLNTSVISLQAAQPILNEVDSKDSSLDPAGLTGLLVEIQPQLLEARAELDEALAVRKSIEAENLSPRLHGLLTEELDPLLTMADDGLSLMVALPGILGATQEGPKTYLVLVQNEDELRPTGGFITSVGNLVLRNGQVISLDFEGVDYQEDWSKPYPAAPWQLQEYMNSSILILRDSNWFADFPTSVLWAEYLYAYTHSHSVDGVIAFDQQFLVMLLDVIGPLDVDGVSYPISSANVIEYMRAAKKPPSGGEPIPEGWDRKEFISKIADIVLMRLAGGENNDWRGLAGVLAQALEERHLLLQFDDQMTSTLLARHGWDNAVRSAGGDFLMTTDTNIGFNKTNALMNISLSYDVDLTDVSAPRSTLNMAHKNNASGEVPCIHFDTEPRPDYYYIMDRCYWSYFRVYKQAGAELLDASPHAIPGEWMLLGRDVPARVDELDEELAGVHGFGTLLVVPGAQTLNTGFSFALPPSVLIHENGSNQFSYQLKVQKQPGTLANPLVIRIHLPNRSTLESITMDAIIQDNNLLIETDLRTDVELELVFSIP